MSVLLKFLVCQNVARPEEYVGSTFFALKNERLTVRCSVINFLAVLQCSTCVYFETAHFAVDFILATQI